MKLSISKDGENFEDLDVLVCDNPKRQLEVADYRTSSYAVKARFIKLNIKHHQPKNRKSGNALMIDEIMVF